MKFTNAYLNALEKQISSEKEEGICTATINEIHTFDLQFIEEIRRLRNLIIRMTDENPDTIDVDFYKHVVFLGKQDRERTYKQVMRRRNTEPGLRWDEDEMLGMHHNDALGG